MEFVRVYPIGLLAPRAARHSLDLLIGLVRPAPLMDLRVIVSEFVTNSVRHAGQHDGDPITVRVDCTEARVRIEVEDGGPGFTPVFPRPDPERDSRWGLYLVDRLADRWGTGPSGRVWAEVDLSPQSG